MNLFGTNKRYHDLDALRVTAMLLGVVLHAALFVAPEAHWRWPLRDPLAQGAPTYGIIIDFVHGFRIPVFFMLSGFFSALLCKRRGIEAFRRQRLHRVGIPWIFGCLTIVPATVWILKIISSQQNLYSELYEQVTLVNTPFIFIASMAHLWFLWYLLLIAFVFIGLLRLGLGFHSPWWWLLILTSSLVTLFMKEPLSFGADSAAALIPELPLLIYYMCFFLVGVVIHHRGVEAKRWWSLALLPAIPLFPIGLKLIETYRSAHLDKIIGAKSAGELYTDYLFTDATAAVTAVVEPAFAWLVCFGLMGLFRCLFGYVSEKVGRVTRYISDSAYWIYLVHLPVVVLAQWLVIEWPVSHHLKYLFVLCSAIAFGFLTYVWFVRYTIVGHILNGPRKRPGDMSNRKT